MCVCTCCTFLRAIRKWLILVSIKVVYMPIRHKISESLMTYNIYFFYYSPYRNRYAWRTIFFIFFNVRTLISSTNKLQFISEIIYTESSISILHWLNSKTVWQCSCQNHWFLWFKTIFKFDDIAYFIYCSVLYTCTAGWSSKPSESKLK